MMMVMFKCSDVTGGTDVDVVEGVLFLMLIGEDDVAVEEVVMANKLRWLMVTGEE